MPVTKLNSRVTRSTASSRCKAVAAKKIPHRKKTIAVSSPGWVPGHPDLFQVPESFSPKRPITRRSSAFKRVSSPSRYKNAKIPSSNCRRTGKTKNISNNSPTRYGVLTRSRRSSIYHGNAAGAPLILAPMTPPAPVLKPPAPVRSISRRSTKSKDSSKASLSQASNHQENTLVFQKPISVLQSEMSIGNSSEETPSTEETQSIEMVDDRMSMGQPNPSAVSMISGGRSITPSSKSTDTVDEQKISETSSYSKTDSADSMFPVKSIPTMISASPSPSEEFIVPSPSDPEISFNASKQNLDTPRSKRFLESIELSPLPMVTKSFCPSSAKKSKLALPVSAKSEKMLTSTLRKLRGRSLMDNSIEANSSGLSSSFSMIPQTSKTINTPTRSLRDMSLRDISACSSRLDSTNPLDVYQTPKTQKSLVETETLFETPENSVEEMENKENEADINESMPSVEVSQTLDASQPIQSSSSRCTIL